MASIEQFLELLQREFVYIWYYFDFQLRQIFWYWVFGILIGSAISVFAKVRIHRAAERFGGRLTGIVGVMFASALGIASPLCMYGTVPVCAAFSQKGVHDDFLAAFMMSSVLLNPQLVIYSMALGVKVLVIRIVSCFLCGVCAGILIWIFFCRKREKSGVSVSFFDFSPFEEEPQSHDTEPSIILRFLKNILRNIRATGPMFPLGIVLSALFQRYVPAEAVAKLFGKNSGFGLLMAAALGVPLYVCGGGTIPLLQQWLAGGMSVGSAASFMIVGPATKITNLGALKTALGAKHFALYVVYVIMFAVLSGTLTDIFF